MATNRKLINYLPPYMQEYLEMAQIMGAEQPEFDFLWDAYEQAMLDQFIHDATEYGVGRWERMLKITPRDNDTLDERKFRILARLNQELPYTITKLKEALTTLCGIDGYTIDLQPNLYHIEVRLNLGTHSNYLAVVDVLKKMIPANMTQYVKLMYNPHSLFRPWRHIDMAEYTHNQLRSEVFDDA